MKIIDHPQGSNEWIMARVGLPTASNFDKIVTPTGKLSSASNRYLSKLVAEWYLGQPLDDYASALMDRGTELEATAVRFYEFDGDVETAKVGLCLRDDGLVGGSPDRLVGEDGLLEIKCPSAEVHMSYVLGGLTDDYRCQVQGLLWITGRKWCDLLAWNPILPPAKMRYERDDEFIDLLAKSVDQFVERLEGAKRKLAQLKGERDLAVEIAMETADTGPF